LPLFLGDGFVHVRVLLFDPIPHVTEHEEKPDQSLKPPSTE